MRSWRILRKKQIVALVLLAVFPVPAIATISLSSFEIIPAENQLYAEKFFRTELYFGFGKKDGTEVTADEWSKFLADVVTPRFPDGLTVVEAIGQFRGSSGAIVREHSRMLILLYKKRNRETAGKKIDEIRAAYCKQFAQESVLRIDFQKSVDVSFE
jgi:hypothetical protein